jgi:hypothetical protein
MQLSGWAAKQRRLLTTNFAASKRRTFFQKGILTDTDYDYYSGNYLNIIFL